MKKILSVLVAALLLIAPTALAQEFRTYHNDLDGYEVGYPADWIIVETSTIDVCIAEAQAGKLGVENVTAELLAYIKNAMSTQGVDMMICFGPKNSRFNVLYQNLSEPSQQGLLDGIPAVIEQCETVYQDFAVVEPGAVNAHNGREFVEMIATYTYEDMPMLYYQSCHLQGSRLYTFTFTVNTDEQHGVQDAEELIAQVLDSFTPPEA